ncbi:putative LRR containing protein [Trachipleistophora hominis]|uniref:Putative LRR containing protein n=1 Tax=Trachipleistophora hominis TaxID=72359 RepID=L7K0B1_TRAHO|nr:putative LRR containing protein [Trachipleistophora hominis]
MLANLYSYVEITMKYILIFETAPDKQQDYMIFEDLDDTGIKNFLSTCSRTTLTEVSDYDFGRYDVKPPPYKKTRRTNEYVGYNATYFSKHFHGKDIKDKSYKDIIEEEHKTEFRVINVPFSKTTFEKIYELKIHDDIIFTNEEIYLIFFYLYPHKENMTKLTRVICFHLQRNPTMVQELFDIAQDCNIKYNDRMTCLAMIINPECHYVKDFRRTVKSSIIFALKDKRGESTTINNNTTHYNAFYYEIELDKLNIAFLIESLAMSYDYFALNHNILYEKFRNVLDKSCLVIKIHNIHGNHDYTRPELTTETTILKCKLTLIAESEFLKCSCIQEIILQFNNVQVSCEYDILKSINKLSMVIFELNSFENLKSIPKEIKNHEMILKNVILEPTLTIPDTLKRISFQESQFCESLIFPNYIQSVAILRSDVNQDATIIFDENCENVEIDETYIRIKFQEYVELNYILLTGKKYHNGGKLCYSKGKCPGEGFFIIHYANIFGRLILNINLQKVDFFFVNMSMDSQIVLCAHNKYFDISLSEGFFDLSDFIGISLHFTRKMSIKTDSIEGSTGKLLKIIIKDMELSENIVLSDCFESVELENVTLKNSSILVLNSKCKTLIIKNFDGVIKVHDRAMRFETVDISFAVNTKINIFFLGVIYADNLHLSNACRNIERIKCIFSTIQGVRNLKFTRKFTHEWSRPAEKYINTLRRIPGYQEIAEKYSKILSENSSVRSRLRKELFYKTSTAVVNSVLKTLLNASVIETIQKIEFKSITLDDCNYEILYGMKNLQILSLGHPNFTSALFSHLPFSLRLLDISWSDSNCEVEVVRHGLTDLMNLQRCYSLNVLVIDAGLFFQAGTLNFVPSSVTILKVYFTSSLEKFKSSKNRKLYLNELYIEGEALGLDQNSTEIGKTNAYAAIKALKKCIEFEYLKQFAFVCSNVRKEIDPYTLKFYKRESEKFFTVDKQKHDEMDIFAV